MIFSRKRTRKVLHFVAAAAALCMMMVLNPLSSEAAGGGGSIEEAWEVLNQAQADYDRAETALKEASAALEVAKTGTAQEVKDAEDAYKARLEEEAKLRQQLEEAETAYEQVKEYLEEQKATVATLKAADDEAAATLAQAQAEYDSANKAYTAAYDEYLPLENQAKSSQEEVKKYQTELKQLEQSRNNCTDPDEYNRLSAKMSEVNGKLTEANSNYLAAMRKAEDALRALDQAKRNLDSALHAYNAAYQAKGKSAADLAAAQEVLAGYTAKETAVNELSEQVEKAAEETAAAKTAWETAKSEAETAKPVITPEFDPPVINGIKDGGTYCIDAEFTVSDTTLISVTANGERITATGGKYTLPTGTYEIVAADIWGNKTAVKITVNEDHTYEWVTDKEATADEPGQKHEQCIYCDHAKAPVEIPTIGAAPSQINVKLKATWSDSTVNIRWSKVKGAEGYEVYGERCGKKIKLIKDIKSGDATALNKVKKIGGKKLNTTKSYKFKVKAYRYENGEKVYIQTSKGLHVAGSKSSTYTNPKAIKVNKTAVTVGEGKTTKIKGTAVKRNSGKKLLGTNHCKKVRYFSANPAIAKINGSGVITGVSSGTCKVYVMGANGVKKTVTVTVK